jgi:hypothetical protein
VSLCHLAFPGTRAVETGAFLVVPQAQIRQAACIAQATPTVIRNVVAGISQYTKTNCLSERDAL